MNIVDIVVEATTKGAEKAFDHLAEEGLKDSAKLAEGFVKNNRKIEDSTEQTGKRTGERYEKTMGATDELATKTGTLTGAFGALAGSSSLVGLGAYSGQLQMAAMATDLVSGASDIATLAMEKLKLNVIATKIATATKTATDYIASAATKAWAGAQWLLNAALDANPVMLLVIGIAALVAIIIVIATKTTWFQDIWRAAWGAITGAVSATINWVKTHWPLLLVILTGPIGLAVLAIKKYWSNITDGFGAVVNGVKTGVAKISGFITGIPGAIGKTAAHAFDALATGARNAFGAIAHLWNITAGRISIHTPDIPGTSWGGLDFSVPKIPGYAHGGIGAGLALVGEHGRELVNLGSGGGRVRSNPDTERLLTGGGGATATVVFDFTGADSAILELFRKAIRVRGGNVQIVLGNG